MSGHCWIEDYGSLFSDRYAVLEDQGFRTNRRGGLSGRRVEKIDSSNDLPALQQKYNLPAEPVRSRHGVFPAEVRS